MKTTTMAAAILLGVLGVAISDSGFAQSALGGAKTPQNKIGGAAKPPPVVGGAAGSIKPGLSVGVTNQALSGGKPMLGGTGNMMAGQTPGTSKPNPPGTPPKNAVITTSNLKCASGACAAAGPKP